MRVLAQRERNEAAFPAQASLVATRHDRNRSRTISFNRWCAASSLISNTSPPARASGRLLTAGRIAVFNAPLASMPSTTPPNKPHQPSSRSCGVARHDLAPTPFEGSATSRAFPRARPTQHDSPTLPLRRDRTPPVTARRPSPHAAPRPSPQVTVVPPRRLRWRLAGTRAHRPEAEHAGRTTLPPRGGINAGASTRAHQCGRINAGASMRAPPRGGTN